MNCQAGELIKRILALILIMIFMFGCSIIPENEDIQKSKSNEETKITAVWIYYNELSMKEENGGTRTSFTEKMDKIFTNCVNKGVNTVFVQVRPFCDAFYPSKIFPWTSYLTGTQGKAVDYNPLEIMISLAHSKNLSIHAWINPFRISFQSDKEKLADNNPALKWIDNKDKSLSSRVVKVNDGFYFSPASVDAQKLVLDGVREIIENYDVDGIHIDDYFYPSTEKYIDSFYYDAYVKDGGELKLNEWRLSVISSLVMQMYSVVKSTNEKCIFSISPAGNIDNNYNHQYADIKLWCAENGYADWIIPQLYYSFNNKVLNFTDACDSWISLPRDSSVKIICGIAVYKLSDKDDEWKVGSGIINKQINYALQKSYNGVALFSYTSIINEENSVELNNLDA